MVLVISILYRGCAVPVAWKVLKAQQKHPWQPEWLALLQTFKERVLVDWTVIVLADRGLYAKWLFKGVVKLGWHPFLCVNVGGSFRPEGERLWQPFKALVPAVGLRWQGRGTAFSGSKSRLRCTLLGHWSESHQDPWLILTDLPPECADACWYGLCTWIERGFKYSKRSGWQWQHTRMDDPARAERLWMAIALATWWLLSVGGETEAEQDKTLDIPIPTTPGSARRRGKRWRLVGIFQHGYALIVTALLNHQLLAIRPASPEAWPSLSGVGNFSQVVWAAGGDG